MLDDSEPGLANHDRDHYMPGDATQMIHVTRFTFIGPTIQPRLAETDVFDEASDTRDRRDPPEPIDPFLSALTQAICLIVEYCGKVVTISLLLSSHCLSCRRRDVRQ